MEQEDVQITTKSGHTMEMVDDPKFIRSYRWTLSDLDESVFKPYWMESIEIDHVKHELSLVCFDMQSKDDSISTMKIVRHMPEKLKLTNYDGTGNVIRNQTFSGVKTLKCTQKFDYADSSISTIHFLLSYDSRKII